MDVRIIHRVPNEDVTQYGRRGTTRRCHCVGSNPTVLTIFGDIAQSVEQRAENPRVKGSTPFVSTISEYSAVGSATALGAVGRWFESSYSDQIGVSSNGKTWVFGA